MRSNADRFLQETLEFWQKRTKRTLSLEDAREIVENMSVFFEVLAGGMEAPLPLTKNHQETSS